VGEFAALTTSEEYASRDAILLRVRRPPRSSTLPVLNVSIGIAHFNPVRPVSIDELLDTAKRSMNEPLGEWSVPERFS
jgi:hypothetical protein